MMYCPKCGLQNDDETKFCRGCGENLKVISQAMTRRLPVILASKMDAYLERKNERIFRDSIITAAVGCFFTLLGVYNLIAGERYVSVFFQITLGGFMFVHSLWDYLVYKRSLSLNGGTENDVTEKGPIPSTVNELPPRDIAQTVTPFASITESTTRHLDEAIRRQDKNIS